MWGDFMILYATYSSPFGQIRIGYENEDVVSIGRGKHEEKAHMPSALTDRVNEQLQEYFAGNRKDFDFPVRLSGTNFQMKVWRVLSEIPYGQTRTYGEIAAAIGNKNASRAVGMACSKNPLWIIVPCHRVVGCGKKLTGYAGGIAMKQALLELEQE